MAEKVENPEAKGECFNLKEVVGKPELYGIGPGNDTEAGLFVYEGEACTGKATEVPEFTKAPKTVIFKSYIHDASA
ncbi:hypothetical protein [Streptomyces venezuelae]